MFTPWTVPTPILEALWLVGMLFGSMTFFDALAKELRR